MESGGRQLYGRMDGWIRVCQKFERGEQLGASGNIWGIQLARGRVAVGGEREEEGVGEGEVVGVVDVGSVYIRGDGANVVEARVPKA